MNHLTNERGSGGVGFFGLLAVVFITLKLLGTITWSWWLVTAPLWGGFALWAVVFIFALVVAGLVGAFK